MLAGLPSGSKSKIEDGVAVLRSGGVIAFPTDTVYGLGCSVNIPEAVARVYQLKKRPFDMPLPVLLSHVSQLDSVAAVVTPVARLLAEEFWPGALTLLLARSGTVPDIVTAGGATVAVRIPAHPVPLALIDGLGGPVIGTSANVSGHPSALTASEVYAQFGDELGLVIENSGTPLGGTESTIVDVSGDVPRVLRVGAIPAVEIKRICGELESGSR